MDQGVHSAVMCVEGSFCGNPGGRECQDWRAYLCMQTRISGLHNLLCDTDQFSVRPILMEQLEVGEATLCCMCVVLFVLTKLR